MAGSSPLASATDFGQSGTVNVFIAVSVVEDTTIDFGAVVPEDGTIVLGLANSITSDPAGIHVGSSTVTTGAYTISGEPSQLVAVTMTGSTANGLQIDVFTSDAADLNNVALDVAGDATIAIGASLIVTGASTIPGTNALAFTLGITYN